MDENSFSPLEWENHMNNSITKELFLKTRDYESNQGSLTSFVEQGYVKLFKSQTKNPLSKDLLQSIPSLAHLFMCAAKWSKYRQIYSFDKTLLDYLLENVNATSINSNMLLYKLPFPAFYVKNTINIGKYCVEGFYVYLNKFNENNRIALEINAGVKNTEYTFTYTIALEKDDEFPLNEYIKFSTEDNTFVPEEDLDSIEDTYSRFLQAAIILITYLCTDKVDVVRRKEEYTPRNSKNKKPKKADLKLVGAKTARVIKERKIRYVYEDSKEVTGDRKGKSKAAHFRSAHYHSFWTGKRSEPENRQLIVKLLDPIFVNGTDKETPVTERRVVKEGRTNNTERK